MLQGTSSEEQSALKVEIQSVHGLLTLTKDVFEQHRVESIAKKAVEGATFYSTLFFQCF